MAKWMFDKHGKPRLILDDNMIRNNEGVVISWINNSSLYNLSGAHIGWFEGGVIYDSRNSVLAFTQDRTGYLPYTPGLSGIPGMPGFAGVPGRPGLAGTPGRPGCGGWSNFDVEEYFS